MKASLSLTQTNSSPLDYIKQSALEYMINYLFDGLESFERDPADSDFQLGYEQALHDTMVDLLRCHMLANLPATLHGDQTAAQDS
jgi:hypothetical protein